MAAILTDKFRVIFAEKFKEAIEVGENQTLIALGVPTTTIWLFFAKSVAWTDGVVLDPTDNQQDSFKIYDQVIGLKKIPSAEIRQVIRNNKWIDGTIYDIYRDDYGKLLTSAGTTNTYVQGLNFEQHLYETNYYVVTSEYKVYKCLSNNKNSPSTVQPSSVSAAPFTLSDGYVWKYMFTVNANDFEKFKTDEYIPIPTSVPVSNQLPASSNFGGSIYNVVIDSAGTGYTANTEYDIVGDGTGGRVKITSVSQSGAITSVLVINPGTGYTYGQINLGSGGGSLTPIISPKEGTAVSIGRELGAYRVALHAKLDKDDFVFGNDFSVVGLLYNPTVTTTGTDVAIGTKQLILASPLNGTLEYNDLAIRVTAHSTGALGVTETAATGRIVHYENSTRTIYFTQENVASFGMATDGKRASFLPGDTISIGENQETATIASGNTSVKSSGLTRGSGEIIYIDNRSTISRAKDQTEDFKIILEF